ncbi:NAD(+) diphosphatase [Corynebacterium ammoniagenes]|uniref:NAD(+) diphosphatase n=2 Tax=Corynebacterium ammoniagenes TaxID=1697 RepID=A0AAV5G9M6_CORAM|nr:NAD(+) diphosphatase [Corynebacterium ammoniagenes]APT83198.1 NUDIX hydrolase [Corynebacterium ammoniagenes DSM 20306]AQS74224.1 NUDIX hydrolase [Corynebacterium ammoniagenes]EFG81568.1 hydrolase, NUDIX family [Corynebacterium ammoniagenes DSM 20306]NMF32993.1 NUDIX domain-containing protein [Corynebacterium ammoniagenes]GJN43492.1 NTP pyrophosphohydrolase [Corynebacterium ammoniagenes]
MFVPVTETGLVPVDSTGQPILLDAPADSMTVRVNKHPELWACAISEEQARSLGTLASARNFLDDRLITRAIGMMKYRYLNRFDAVTGQRLEFPGTGVVGLPEERRGMLFPRVDPAVISRVHHPEKDAILMGRDKKRPDFFSLIAGYVDIGESLEQAAAREVKEETGFDVVDVTYVASQPWVLSGSLMVGFSAVATYESLILPGPRDGELIEVRWVGKTELEDVNLPGSGSIAHKLLKEWYSQ